MTIYNVTDASTLTDALDLAAAGDTINLADGSYGSYTISARDYNDNTANANPGTWSDNANPWTGRRADFVADPARPENLSLVRIEGGAGAVFTGLTVTNSSGLHLKGFKVSNPTVLFLSDLIRMTGTVCTILDGLQVIGAPLASEMAEHAGTGFGRGRGIHCGTTFAGAAGTECAYITIRGCYTDQTSYGIQYCGGNGLAAPGTFAWIHSNQLYQTSVDAMRVDGATDVLIERNLFPYHYHPVVQNGSPLHCDTVQCSGQGCKRIVITKNIRLPGFDNGGRTANHVGHTEGLPYHIQGPFFDDSSNFEDIESFHNFMIHGYQNSFFVRYANTGTCRCYNNFHLRDPWLVNETDSSSNNNMLHNVQGTGTSEASFNLFGAEASKIGTLYSAIGRGVAYGSWAGAWQVSNFYGIDTTADNLAWQCDLTDLTVVPGSLADYDTYGAGTYGPYELLEELAANDYAWPPPIGASVLPSISGLTINLVSA